MRWRKFLLIAFNSLLIAYTVTLSETKRWLEGSLRSAGIESAEAEARWLLEHLFSTTAPHNSNGITFQQGGFSPLHTVNFETHHISQEQQTLLNQWLERRIKREPLQHILGVAPFYGLELSVTPDVLIPRPETERLVELVLEAIKPLANPKILDVGTGSGAIALAVKHERPDAGVMATDISTKALSVAKQNAEKYKLDVTLLESNLLQHPNVQTFAKTCAVLVANLPYLPSNDKEKVSPEVLHDPDLALYAGHDGLELFRSLEEEAFEIVQPKTLCFFELDPRNVESAFELCQRWQQREVLEDLVERKRFLKLVR
jgi:release factor glutamine methyltransferase